MFFKNSNKVEEMWNKVSPYVDNIGNLKPNTPDDIKKLYARWKVESDKEYIETVTL